jgi:hypothetical protein
VIVALALVFLVAQDPTSSAMREIQRMHIEANVPPGDDFDRFLRRDLEVYFARSHGDDVRVDWEMLRDGPTQSGVAYPKFYAWVHVNQHGTVVDQGAVRLAAIDRKRFDITHFVPERTIRANPSGLSLVFPALVCEEIRVRLRIERQHPEYASSRRR